MLTSKKTPFPNFYHTHPIYFSENEKKIVKNTSKRNKDLLLNEANEGGSAIIKGRKFVSETFLSDSGLFTLGLAILSIQKPMIKTFVA